MMGSGTTPYVASGLDRDAVGIEIRDEYVSEAVERVTTEYKRSDVVVPQYPTRDVT
jgi:DNA modification methylase